MHRFFGEQSAYSLFNNISIVFTLIVSIFYFKMKRKSISSYSRCAIQLTSHCTLNLGKITIDFGKILEFILVSVESLIIARLCTYTYVLNRPFGDMVGTGASYFAVLFTVWIFVILVSLLLFSNPIKQLDYATLFLPFTQFFVRLACYFNGCCWGIPWEHGPYNYHYDHPGNQVPVQAIEAGCVLVFYFFFLWYIKKARTGTIFPLYMILYGGTRFFIEFLTANYPAVLGPFKVNHILSAIAFTVGFIAFLLMRKYGQKLSDFFENKQQMLEAIPAKHKQEKQAKLEEEKAKEEAARLERLEKAKAARERAAKRKK